MANKLFAVALVVILMLISCVSVSAETLTTESYQQPKINNIIYFPAMPDDYNKSIYPYTTIFYNTLNSKYYLAVSEKKIYYLNHYDMFVPESVSSPGYIGFYEFDNNLSKKEWKNKGAFINLNIYEYNAIYSNYDIMNRSDNNKLFKKANNQDWINTTLTLSVFQRYIKNNLSVLVPYSLLVFSSLFITLRLFKWFKGDTQKGVRGKIKRKKRFKKKRFKTRYK